MTISEMIEGLVKDGFNVEFYGDEKGKRFVRITKGEVAYSGITEMTALLNEEYRWELVDEWARPLIIHRTKLRERLKEMFKEFKPDDIVKECEMLTEDLSSNKHMLENLVARQVASSAEDFLWRLERGFLEKSDKDEKGSVC